MTTIAFDGKTLSSDTQASSSYIRQGDTQKIFKKGNKLFAGTGVYSTIKGFIEGKTKLGDEDVVFEINTDTGDCIEHCKEGSYKSKAPVSIGSGCEIAMGAMLAGASSRKAVQIASKLDPYTGGKVKSHSINSNGKR